MAEFLLYNLATEPDERNLEIKLVSAGYDNVGALEVLASQDYEYIHEHDRDSRHLPLPAPPVHHQPLAIYAIPC